MRNAARDSPGACRVALTARADAESFRAAGYDASAARLARLSAATRMSLASAARRLCAAGLLRPSDLGRLSDIVVQNGEGATEPILYRDEAMPRRTIIFQYAFQHGGPPGPAAFEQALRCWKSPKKKDCYRD